LDKFITSEYFKSISTSEIPYISGDLYIANTENTKISEDELKNTYKDQYFPDLNIFVAHAAESYIAKFIEIQDSGIEYE
jgi:hypothetical protein